MNILNFTLQNPDSDVLILGDGLLPPSSQLVYLANNEEINQQGALHQIARLNSNVSQVSLSFIHADLHDAFQL